MVSTLELSVFKLIVDASLFTKLILFTLLLLSIISWSIIFNKYFFLNRYKKEFSRFLRVLINQGEVNYIEESCEEFSRGTVKTIPIVLQRLIRSKRQGQSVLSAEAVMNNAAMHEMGRLQSGMGILASAANISPLIGLLGTVWGIMYSFLNIGQQGSASIAVVAPGIAEALITTIVGLCVAIPAMTAHNLLMVTINKVMDSIDRVNEYVLSIDKEKK